MDDAAELLWQRDQARARLEPLKQENERLRMLLVYASEAIESEYNLRVYGNELRPPQQESDK
jgi:hypothetical protein